MKRAFIFGFCLWTGMSVTAQNYGGGYRGAPGMSMHDSLAQTIAQDEARRSSNATVYARAQAVQHFVPRDPWRAVNGTTNYVKWTGVEFCGRIMETTKDGVRIDGWFGPLFTTGYDPKASNHTSFIVTNLPAQLVNAGLLPSDDHFMAWDLGIDPISKVHKLDYGLPCPPPPPSPAQLEATRARQDAERQRLWLVQSNTVRRLQIDAADGDAGSQYSLGLHYLNGLGCETNREQAIEWLRKSAAQGYEAAANKLAALHSP